MDSTTAVICDDHPIFRAGVVHCLAAMGTIEVVAEAGDLQSAIAKLQLYEPDLLITDLSLPGGSGFDLLEWAKKNQAGLRVFVLSMHNAISFAQRAKVLGAAGYLAKEDTESELLHAIKAPQASFYTSQSIGSESAASLLQDDALEFKAHFKNVSPAERRVLSELSRSKTSAEIAADLGISVRTVEAHRRSLATKLDARGPNKLLEFAIKNRKHLGG